MKQPTLRHIQGDGSNDCVVEAYATLLQISYIQALYRLRGIYNSDTGCHPESLCDFLRKRHGAREVWPLNKRKRAVLLLNWGGYEQFGHAVVYNPGQGVIGDTWGRTLDKHLARVMEIP